MEYLDDIQALNDKLSKMVDKSSVEAVDKANAERKQALCDCEKKIKEIKSQSFHETYEAHEKQRQAEAEAKEAKEKLEKNTYLSFGLLAFTLICCGIMNATVRKDIIDFFVISGTTIYESVSTYVDWLISLSEKMEWYWVWLLRILFSAVIVLSLIGIILGIKALYQKYKKRWCTLSLKALVVSIAVLTVFAEPIRRFIPINIVLLFLFTQVGYLIILWYFDDYYANRYRSDEWEDIQNG